MSNVVALRFAQRPNRAETLTALAHVVATGRRGPNDMFWLKENAEFLNVMAALNEPLEEDALAAYQTFYDTVGEKLDFFPQYYRFLLSITLDLEDLGMPGTNGAQLCAKVQRAGWAEAELSDLQRAEARRLLARRGAATRDTDNMTDRLMRFAERSQTFAVPNKKAAYELTHIAFYLSDYGRRDPQFSAEAKRSLEFAGLVAFIDQNFDLLAEICTAMRFAGMMPHHTWTAAIAQAHAAIRPVAPAVRAADAYHAYMMTGWANALAGETSFDAEITVQSATFEDMRPGESVLRSLSEGLLALGAARRGTWAGMQGRVVPFLSASDRHIFQQAQASTEHFDAFFALFARTT